MTRRALSFALASLRFSWHVLRNDGHFAAHALLFGRIYSLRCVCGEVFWERTPGSPRARTTS